MTDDKKPNINEAIEQIMCAQANLWNLLRIAPALKDNPMAKIVEFQLQEALNALRGNEI